MKIPLKYSIMGGFDLLDYSILQIISRSHAIDNEKTYTPNHTKGKRGKFKRSGKK